MRLVTLLVAVILADCDSLCSKNLTDDLDRVFELSTYYDDSYYHLDATNVWWSKRMTYQFFYLSRQGTIYSNILIQHGLGSPICLGSEMILFKEINCSVWSEFSPKKLPSNNAWYSDNEQYLFVTYYQQQPESRWSLSIFELGNLEKGIFPQKLSVNYHYPLSTPLITSPDLKLLFAVSPDKSTGDFYIMVFRMAIDDNTKTASFTYLSKMAIPGAIQARLFSLVTIIDSNLVLVYEDHTYYSSHEFVIFTIEGEELTSSQTFSQSYSYTDLYGNYVFHNNRRYEIDKTKLQVYEEELPNSESNELTITLSEIFDFSVMPYGSPTGLEVFVSPERGFVDFAVNQQSLLHQYLRKLSMVRLIENGQKCAYFYSFKPSTVYDSLVEFKSNHSDFFFIKKELDNRYYFTRYRIVCPKGYYQYDDCMSFECFNYTNLDNEKTCNGRGYCDKPNHCVCEHQYFGQKCLSYNCFGKYYNHSSVCNGKGRCTHPDGCNCEKWYYGKKCQNDAKKIFLWTSIVGGTLLCSIFTCCVGITCGIILLCIYLRLKSHKKYPYLHQYDKIVP